jgi:hypothetical protein
MILLESLYGSVIIPDVVAGELGARASPSQVRSWISAPPAWVRVESATPEQLSAVTPELDPGERAAIALATAFSADLLLIDEARGRVEAHRRRLALTGTLGVLRLDVPATLGRLRATTFYVDSALIEDVFGRWTR